MMKRFPVKIMIALLALSFSLSGVATTSAQEPEVQVAGAAVPSSGTTPFFGILDGAVDGRLTPTTGAGAFAGFCVDIAGGEDPLTIRAIFDQVNPGEEDGIGYNLYRIANGAHVLNKVIGRNGSNVDVADGYSAEEDASGPHFLQVFNVFPGRTVGFSLQVFTVPEEGGQVELGPGLITEVGDTVPTGAASSCADLLPTLPLATGAGS